MNPSVELLNTKVHIRENFTNQHPSLQNYLRSYARQDADNDLARSFVLVDQGMEIKGFYTLSCFSVPIEKLSSEFIKKNKIHYKYMPATLLGRLAVDTRVQGLGYGKVLLHHALTTAANANRKVASAALIVDPIDEEAKRFYERYGFTSLPGAQKMYIAMRAIENSIR